MRAMVLRELAGPLHLTEVPIPAPGPGEVRVRVRATGVGLTVVIMTANPGLVTSFPRIPGHEVAGDVVELGPGVQGVSAGDRIACHFYLTCGTCSFCRGGRETLCERFGGYLGMAADGGYAEYLVVPARNLCRIPEGVSYLDAAIGADAIATPLHACREEARVGPGDKVMVVGAGGGVEAAIDFVSSAETLEACMRSLAPAGRLVIVGNRPKAVFGKDPTFRVEPGLMLRKMLEIHGSRYVTMAELAQTLELLRQKRVKAVVTRTFRLEELETAHQLLRENAIAGRAAALLD